MAEKATYFSKFSAYSIVLRPTRTAIIDGIVKKTPGLHAQFRDGKFTTTDSETIKLMDGLLNGENAGKYRRFFRKKPGETIYREARRIQKGIEEKKEELLKTKTSQEAFEKTSEFDAFLATQTKEKRPGDHKGMRDI
jgi:hypothetical protein